MPNGSTLSRERRQSQPTKVTKPNAPLVGCSVLFGGLSQGCHHSTVTFYVFGNTKVEPSGFARHRNDLRSYGR
jgi:hypothetical protein